MMCAKNLAIICLLLSLLFVTACEKREYLTANSKEDFRQLFRTSPGLGSSDFVGAVYCGTDSSFDYLVFEHFGGDDVVVKLPVGVLRLKGAMEFRGYSRGVPLALMIETDEYANLFK